MLIGTNLQYTKTYNVRIVLETIRLFGPLSRGDIARRTELTAQTVTNITKQLIHSGLILEGERIQDGRGAPSRLLKLNPDGAFSIGLDLDRDHLTGILVDLSGVPRQRIGFDLNFPSPDEAMILLERTAKELIDLENVSIEKIKGVGVGLPGPLAVSEGSQVKNIVNPVAIPGWTNVPVIEMLNKGLSLPIYLENNASAAAIGELWYGAGRHIKSFFYVYFGAGLGGGIVINGQPFSGHTGNAGELGYYPSTNNPESVGAMQHPHIGLYFNLPNLYAHLQQNGSNVRNTTDLEALFEQGNGLLLNWIATGASQLAPVILAIEYLIDPDAIFFGGRLPDPIIRRLLEQLKTIIPASRIKQKAASPDLLPATAGSDAAALGVATLPIYESLAPLPKLLLKNTKRRTESYSTASLYE